MPENPAAPKLIYLDCREGAAFAPHLSDHLENALRGGKFRLADSPSKAGYILHVNVLGKGEVSPQALRGAVDAGYGAKAKFSGSGADAMLVDAIMVQRRVPESGKASKQRIKNISARNALKSGQMRIGVLAEGSKRPAEEYSAAIARELALRVNR